MRLQRATNPAVAGPLWHERVVILWEEDDATRGQNWEDHGHENGTRAFKRITGHEHHRMEQIKTYSEDDTSMVLHPGGWVSGMTCEGGFVGVMVVEVR